LAVIQVANDTLISFFARKHRAPRFDACRSARDRVSSRGRRARCLWPHQSARRSCPVPRFRAPTSGSNGCSAHSPGRSLLIGLIVKSLTAMISAVAGGLPPVIDAIDMVGSLALIFAAAYGLTRFVFWAKRGLLWRVRRKLILSYVFVGVVPVLLVITFFLLAACSCFST
jgi:hypothetical protein